MKKPFVILSVIIMLCFTLFAKAQTPGNAVVPPDTVLKNMANLLNYYSAHLRFGGDFIAYNEAGHITDKGEFLKALTTGNYLPVQVVSKNKACEYRLLKLRSSVNEDIRGMLKQIGLTDYGRYQMLGKPFPKFNYVDLNGNTYTTENTKGKIVVLKGWFISCAPCVAEMPELNKLTEKYKKRKDIVFVSMATDAKIKLQTFIKRTPFNYAVVPVKQNYILNTLHATGFPVHWIIDKQGVVVHMSYDKDEMIPALTKEALKK